MMTVRIALPSATGKAVAAEIRARREAMLVNFMMLYYPVEAR
jgi:hypothetical protein